MGWLRRAVGRPEVLVFLGGIALVATAVYANVRADAARERLQAWAGEAQEIGQRVALVHAGLLEELADADGTLATQRDANLERAQAACARLVAGVDEPRDGVVPLQVPETRNAVEVLCVEVEMLGPLVERRLDDPAAATGIYAAHLDRLLVHAEDLPELIREEARREQGILDRLLGASIVFILLIFGGVSLLVRSRQREQRRLAAEHRRILAATSDGIVGLDEDGRIVLANDASTALLAQSEDRIIGADAHALLHGEEGHPAGACSFRTGEQVSAIEEEFLREDGSRLPVELSVAPVDEEAGELHTVVIFRDVSDRRRVERLRSEFVSVVSHELRTPLTSIHGALGLLRSGNVQELSEQAQRMVDIAYISTERLVRLINDILDVERLDSGEVPLDRRPVDLGGVIDRSVDAVAARAESAGVVIGTDVEGVRLLADPDRLEQTLVNLLGNAVKFSRPGGHIEVRARHRENGVVVEVEDEGRGIPPDRLESIFGRFEQVDSSDSRDLGGTGLGLAISRAIVDQHGGSMWVESEVGEGSTFTFTLPSDRTVDGGEPVTTPATGRVLVCDDDDQLREVVAEILHVAGFEVLEAASGGEAVAAAIEHRPDAIVLDLIMPGTDGWAAARQLKEHEATRRIPIVILSVVADDPSVDGLQGVQERLIKPFVPRQLVAALGRALREEGEPTLLLVEDDLELAQLLEGLFDDVRIRVAHARSGEEAIAWCEQHLPDLISLDIMLPGQDGFEVVDWLRRHDRLRTVPLVVYTARDLGREDFERLRLGETTFLTKGRVPIEAFQERVIELLRRVTEHRVAP